MPPSRGTGWVRGRDLARRITQADRRGARTRVQPLRLHYVRTLDTWAANLESKTDEAIAVTSPAVYARYMKYLTGCADLFRDGRTDVCQFTCEKS